MNVSGVRVAVLCYYNETNVKYQVNKHKIRLTLMHTSVHILSVFRCDVNILLFKSILDCVKERLLYIAILTSRADPIILTCNTQN